MFEHSKPPQGPVASILFVCTGNICRSPLAEALAKAEAEARNLTLRIESAGTGAWHVGEAPCENMQVVAKLYGHDLSEKRARQFVKDDGEFFELVVAMDRRNLMDLKTFGCKRAAKLGDYGLERADVPDPYYFKGFDGYHEVYALVEKGVKNLFDAHFGPAKPDGE